MINKSIYLFIGMVIGYLLAPDLIGPPVFGQSVPVTQAAQLQLNWTDNSTNELNFNIYRCKGTTLVPLCVPLVKLGSTPADVSSYTDTILGDTGNTPYCYSLDASNSAGFSSKAAVVCGRTPAIMAVPGAPYGLRMSVVGVTLP